MSLINKMLQDLDRRNAAHEGVAGPAAGGLGRHVRPVGRERGGSRLFWRLMAVLILAALGGIGWLLWQLTPRSLVTEAAYQPPRDRGGPAAQSKSPPVTPPAPAPQAAAEPAAVKAPEAAATIAVPPSAPAETSAADSKAPDRQRAEAARSAPKKSRRSAAAPPASGKSRRAAAPPETARAEAAEGGKIERRSDETPRDRAENAYRRAVGMVRQGRVAEGMDGLREALSIDPGHRNARQTLVALLLEARRLDEASALLREGLAQSADNTGFAMLLARIMVERNDVASALAVLQEHAASADQNPDFHAFAAALNQRLDRHEEAIEQYRMALRLAPSAGIWWVGLGISYQAVGRQGEALDAFKTARSAGSLSPDLLNFVDRQLKQLQ
jgi:MSHA biogenesis protein MshN